MYERSLLGLAVALALGSSCSAAPVAPPPVAPPPVAFAAPPPAITNAPPPAPEVPGCPPAGVLDPPLPFGAGKMVPLCRDVYVDPAFTIEERGRIAVTYGAARGHVAGRIGPFGSPPPLVVLCKTEACILHFGGAAMRSQVLMPGQRLPGATYTGGSRPTILIFPTREPVDGTIAHEEVHVEIGYRVHYARMPAWFNEGLASAIGGAPRCTEQGPPGIDDLRRLETNAAWMEYTSAPSTQRATYCQARAEVEAWLGRSGAAALFELLAKVRDGASFESVYGPMLTQAEGPIPSVIVSSAPRLGDRERPFSLATWIKPAAREGVLAHVSATAVGTGWCVPFLGFDREGRLVSQVFHGPSAELTSFDVAVAPKTLPLGRWTHVAMTWSPGSTSKLYVGGALAGEVSAPRYDAPGAGAPMYVAWGSSNVGGAGCWSGAIGRGAFRGAMTEMRVYDTALGAAEVAALARTPP